MPSVYHLPRHAYQPKQKRARPRIERKMRAIDVDRQAAQYLNPRTSPNGLSWQWTWLKCREEYRIAMANGAVTAELSSAVFAALRTYGMTRAIGGEITRVHIGQALFRIWPHITALRHVDLDSLHAGPEGVNRSSLVKAFDGLNNIGEQRDTTITLRGKILMLTWGGTPGFDSYVRTSARGTLVGPPQHQDPAWPWRKTLRRISGNEYVDMMQAIATEYQRVNPGTRKPGGVTHGRWLDMAWMFGPT